MDPRLHPDRSRALCSQGPAELGFGLEKSVLNVHIFVHYALLPLGKPEVSHLYIFLSGEIHTVAPKYHFPMEFAPKQNSLQAHLIWHRVFYWSNIHFINISFYESSI